MYHILQDQRNFLRNPPSGVRFNFDFQASHPVAMAVLQEDPKLEEMRFALVPKQWVYMKAESISH